MGEFFMFGRVDMMNAARNDGNRARVQACLMGRAINTARKT